MKDSLSSEVSRLFSRTVCQAAWQGSLRETTGLTSVGWNPFWKSWSIILDLFAMENEFLCLSLKMNWSNVNRPVLQDGWKDGADNLLNGWREWVWSHPARSLTTYQSILDRLLIMWQLGYIERSYRQSEATCRPPRTRRPTWWNSTWSKRLSESSLLGNRSTRLLSIAVLNSMWTQ